jgi:hypothetical protein
LKDKEEKDREREREREERGAIAFISKCHVNVFAIFHAKIAKRKREYASIYIET